MSVRHFVFVEHVPETTSRLLLNGADAICQNLAGSAGLPGVFKAWLSDGTTSAASRLTHHDGPYRLIDSTVIAMDWADLTDGALAHPIDLTELSGPPPPTGGCFALDFQVWTNTTSAGEIFQDSPGNFSCEEWTSDYAYEAAWGTPERADTWSLHCYGFDGGGPNQRPHCLADAALYCFQQ